jgi:putative membrane protein
MAPLMGNLGNAALFAGLGAVLFILVFVIIDLLTPGKLWDVIVEKNNTAGAILVGSVAIGMGMIIAAAIH